MQEEVTQKLQEIFAERLKEHEALSKHLNFRIGGPARWFIDVKTEEELLALYEIVKEHSLPLFILGGGSNTIASDDGFEGVVAKMNMREYRVIEDNKAYVEAGMISVAFARSMVNEGLSGWEWAVSLPGTIGGAIRGNAGCFGGETKDNILSVRVLRDGKILELQAEELEMDYRHSVFKENDDIILSGVFQLEPGDKEKMKKHLNEILEKRKASQPIATGSAGCIFKNYEIPNFQEAELLEEAGVPIEMVNARRVSAGWVVEQLGMKGKKHGDAQVSDVHGNFIMNHGGARAKDVFKLISDIQEGAKERYGINLETEVQYLGS